MTDSDRELLELAAKAAGYEIIPNFTQGKVVVRFFPGDYPNEWSPLTDPGDALRLAVALRLRLEINDTSIVVNFTPGEVGDRPADLYEYPQTVQEKDYTIRHVEHLAATMRAITRAAANIGRMMK